ncbi:hypothetical protein EPN87_02100 [archaeon]|nr:MAG: hypothetical protein EPN87_02100 [archaeon]
MNKKMAIAIAVIVAIAVGAMYFAGILKFEPASTIKSNQEAIQTVGNINTGVQDISSILTNIDEKLG